MSSLILGSLVRGRGWRGDAHVSARGRRRRRWQVEDFNELAKERAAHFLLRRQTLLHNAFVLLSVRMLCLSAPPAKAHLPVGFAPEGTGE